MSKLRITYDPNIGLVVADRQIPITIENTISMFKRSPEHFCNHTFGSELIINQFRVAVKEGLISCENIVFVFNGQELEVDADGRLPHWPVGFCDLTDGQLLRLIKRRG